MNGRWPRSGRITGLTLLFLTFVLDCPVLFFRAPFGAGIAAAFGATKGQALVLGAGFAYFPLLRSMVALLGGPATRLCVRLARGARDPSQREAERIQDALNACLFEGVKPPRNVWIIDSADVPVAFVEGSSLFLQRDAIWSPYLVGLVAHELGHLNSIDQRLATATRWLSYPSLRALARTLASARGPLLIWFLLFMVSVQLHSIAGGHLPRLLNPAWRWWFRKREFSADDFAANLGHGESLAAALEESLPFDVATPWMKGRSHPYEELRIDRLRAHSDSGGPRHRQAQST
jgi:hypothetical protein